MPTANNRLDRTRWLYFAVAGVIVGLAVPGFGQGVGVLGTMFLSPSHREDRAVAFGVFFVISSAALFVALLVGVGHLQKLVFKVLGMVLWLAPIGAFGAIANVVGSTGWRAITSAAASAGIDEPDEGPPPARQPAAA
jgi:Na+/serine symporter